MRRETVERMEASPQYTYYGGMGYLEYEFIYGIGEAFNDGTS